MSRRYQLLLCFWGPSDTRLALGSPILLTFSGNQLTQLVLFWHVETLLTTTTIKEPLLVMYQLEILPVVLILPNNV